MKKGLLEPGDRVHVKHSWPADMGVSLAEDYCGEATVAHQWGQLVLIDIPDGRRFASSRHLCRFVKPTPAPTGTSKPKLGKLN